MNKIEQLIQNLWITIKTSLSNVVHWVWFQLDILLVKIFGEEKVATFYKKLDIAKDSYWDAKGKVKKAVVERIDKESFYYNRIKKYWKIFGWIVFAGFFYIFCIQTKSYISRAKCLLSESCKIQNFHNLLKFTPPITF